MIHNSIWMRLCETTKERKCETTKVQNNERAKVRYNESTKLRKSDAKQRKSDAKQRRWKQGNSERAMRNCERAKRNNGPAKQRHCETTKGRCETATLRNNERVKLRKGDAKKRDFKEILIFETAKQRKGEMALSGHHRYGTSHMWKINKNIIFVLKYWWNWILHPQKHIFRLNHDIFMMILALNMTKCEIGGQLGRHLEYLKRPRINLREKNEMNRALGHLCAHIG